MTPTPDADMDRGGTDSAAALQALLDAGAPLPPGCYGVGSTLVCEDFVGKDAGGAFGGVGGPDNPTLGTYLVWQGPPGGTLLRWRGAKGRLRNLALACARSTSLDRCIDVEAPAGGPKLSTQHLFENVSCDGRFGPVAKGWVFGEDQAANGEFMRLWDCSALKCTYAGVHVPSGTDQAEFFQFRGCTFSYCLYGFAGARTSAVFNGCNFSWCDTAFWLNGGSGRPSKFGDGCSSEGCRQFVRAYGDYSVSIFDSRINMIAAPAAVQPGEEFFYGGNELVLERVVLEDKPTQSGYFRPTNGGNGRWANIKASSPSPFANDSASHYVLRTSGVRLADGAVYLPDATYFCGPYCVYPRIAAGDPQPRSLADALAALRPA